METTVEIEQKDSSIRSRRSALLMGGAALAGLALSRNAEAQAAVTDNDILNFALNLEYLEAQFYSLAVNGTTIDPSLTASGDGNTKAGTVTYKPGLKAVPFTTPQLAAYAKETANDELNHVKFLRTQLSTNAVAMPNIDLQARFNALAQAAGIGSNFDPFDGTEASFLLGAFIFEDVGVSAYLGAAPLISSSAILTAALDIHAVEAYHAGSIRTQIYRSGGPTAQPAMLSQAVAKTRAMLGGTDPSTDIGVGTATTALGPGSTIVDASTATGRVQPRTTTQVLGVVYGGGAPGKGGAFFPNGMNGTIR